MLANTTTESNATTESAKPKWTWTDARRTLFPIYGEKEVTKFLLIGSIKFFIILALTLTRDTKDTLVVTQCGAEAIAFLKIYGVLPAATAFIALYSKMSDALGKTSLFYATCIPFFTFFCIFDLLIYPNADKLHPSLSAIQAILPGNAQSGGMAVLASIMTHWTSALFYIVSEIYSSVSVGLLFWQFANDVVPVDQAKRFYPLFAQMSGLAPVLAGQYVVRYASKAPDFGSSMHRLTAAVTFAGVMICFFYNASVKFVAQNDGIDMSSSPAATTSSDGQKKKKPKMSMMESIKFLASSQYLRFIAALVLGYGLSINFTEVMWKSLVKKQYPNPLDYQRFMGNFSSAVGLSTCIVILFGVHVIRILGWRVGAMATPAIMALLSAPFFVCILAGLDSPTRLHLAVILGTIQSLLSKTSKYALFDPTTQMAYIPLDDDSKVKGKAAIDVLGSRIGKSGGSFIQQILVFSFGNIINAAPAVGVIFYSVLFAWMSAANKLSHLFVAQTEMDKANQQMEKEKAKEE
ncbi:ADP/ATP translocase [Nitzschia inconspicua]|uniref:ADP,ATP carrier protein n=1 Tax=Nitzschia inconspicua TaxID=303405 RepID=A0A9K3LR26_9STRA|nr:ADP/ATP translocase [Nitzschia inconspicua]